MSLIAGLPLYSREIAEVQKSPKPESKPESGENVDPAFMKTSNDVALVKTRQSFLFEITGIRPVCLLKIDGSFLFGHSNLVSGLYATGERR